jgi:hypothetical protein
MTKLLEKAFARATRLPSEEQDARATIILDELADERRWAETFRASQVALEKLAEEALAANERDETSPLDFDSPR